MDTISDIKVDRTEQGNFRINWKPRVENLWVSVFAGQSPETIDFIKPAMRVTNQSSVVLQDLDPNVRQYFAVKPDGQRKIITAECTYRISKGVTIKKLASTQ